MSMNKFNLEKKMEDEYVEDCKTRLGPMTNETEYVLRFGFNSGFMAAFDIAREGGIMDAINNVRGSLFLPNATVPKGLA